MFLITLEGAGCRVVASLKERILSILGVSHTLGNLWRRRSCQDDDFFSSLFLNFGSPRTLLKLPLSLVEPGFCSVEQKE